MARTMIRIRVRQLLVVVVLSPARAVAAGPGLTLELDLASAFGAEPWQDQSPLDEEPPARGASAWSAHLIPAFWVPVVFEGTVDVGPIRTEIDLDASDIYSGLDFALEGGLVVSNEDWSFLLYASYFKLGSDVQSQQGIGFEETSMEYQMTIADFAVGKRLGGGPIGDDGSWRADLLGGLRYWDQKIEIDQTDPVGFDPMITESENWIDAFVGGRVILDISEDVAFWFRGDVGGFSIGSSSELTWSLTAMLELRLNDAWVLIAGYRYVDVDWETGSGADRFEFDYKLHGPLIGVSVRF